MCRSLLHSRFPSNSKKSGFETDYTCSSISAIPPFSVQSYLKSDVASFTFINTTHLASKTIWNKFKAERQDGRLLS